MASRQFQQFKDLFCERFHCPPAQFEKRAFRKCLYLHARLLAPAILLVNRGFFAEDLKFINYLGDATGFRDASVDVLNFGDVNRGNPTILRTGLRLRISGRKAAKLAKKLFAEARRNGL